MKAAPSYQFEVNSKPSLPLVDVPLVKATEQSVEGYGRLVRAPGKCDIEIVRWPAQGWRPVDEDTGDEGGTVEGTFRGQWEGDVLLGSNSAVGGEYILGFSCDPSRASREQQTCERERVLLWHFNYHPDGGQMFFPMDDQPFVVPVAMPGDDLTPDKVIAFWCEGGTGLYIHPGIWHEGIFPVGDDQSFIDRQGAVHARISCDFESEFGIYLSVPLVLD